MSRMTMRTGSLTLLLLVTAIVLSVLAVLAVQASQVNLASSTSFEDNTVEYYSDDAYGQELLAKVDEIATSGGDSAAIEAALPAECTVDAGQVSAIITNGAAVDESRVKTTAPRSDEGIASSGLNGNIEISRSALSIVIGYDSNGAKVLSWKQIRIYI